ncbi:uncharacterized protein CLIB1444_03S07316 [[Candida] jaroonii]|uniref:Uncharacterized protein n=1 Tax=[Candida] jaroonii TaxID=467808 RepID=A0ACA9Y6G3_9ASCO|nr:uncharacterized protein CLIB1444_03S07316 [[Candida] jaroonii]
MGLGRIFHYSVDLVLVSVILAGIHRNTGLVFDTSNLSSIDFRRWFGNYLSFGESCYDKLVSLLKYSGYFKQRNMIVDYLTREGTKVLDEKKA